MADRVDLIVAVQKVPVIYSHFQLSLHRTVKTSLNAGGLLLVLLWRLKALTSHLLSVQDGSVPGGLYNWRMIAGVRMEGLKVCISALRK